MAAIKPARKMEWLNVLCTLPELSPTDFRVAYQIANHVNSISGKAWMGKQRLGSRTARSTRTVQRSIGKLVRLGHLKRRGRRGTTSEYELLFLFEAGEAPTQQNANSDLPPGQLVSRNGDNNVSLTWKKNNTLTSFADAALGVCLESAKQRALEKGWDGILADPRRAQWEAKVVADLGPDAPEIMASVPTYFLKYLLGVARDGKLSATDVRRARSLARKSS